MPPWQTISGKVIMKSKTNNIKEKIRNQNGAVIVEASIVIPVMFFVLFFIIFIGNMYYEQAKVDEIVLTYATKGAKYVADPSLYDIDNGHPVSKNVDNTDIEPYRYIFGSISEGTISKIEDKISEQVKTKINENSLVLFSNGETRYVGTDNKKVATFKNYVVYSTFVVQVNYEVKFPIRFLGSKDPTVIKLSSRAEVAVSDAPEFIRNVDMVVDLMEGTKASETIKSIFEKIDGFVDKFTKK